MHKLAVVVLVVGCGGSSKGGDPCQQFVDKSAPVLEKTAAAAGTTLPKDTLEAMVKECRDRKGDHGKDKALFDCVIAAKDQDAVAGCWESGMKAYKDAAGGQGGGGGGRANPQAELVLNRLGKNLKVLYIERAAFPEGTAALTPECCSQPGRRCAPDPAVWTGVWQQLDFTMDEPHNLQLSYEGTKTGFTVKALIDDDCDGDKLELTLTGSAPDGNPRIERASAGSD